MDHNSGAQDKRRIARQTAGSFASSSPNTYASTKRSLYEQYPLSPSLPSPQQPLIDFEDENSTSKFEDSSPVDAGVITPNDDWPYGSNYDPYPSKPPSDLADSSQSPELLGRSALPLTGRSDFERFEPLPDLAVHQSRGSRNPDMALLSDENMSSWNDGSRSPSARAGVDRGSLRVPSQQAQLVNPESDDRTAMQEHAAEPYTPSVYNDGIWANDPRVGLSLPVFSPVPHGMPGGPINGASADAGTRLPSSNANGRTRPLSPQPSPVSYQALAMWFTDLKASQDQRFDDVLGQLKKRMDKMEKTLESISKAVKRADAHNLEFATEAKDDQNHVKDAIFQLDTNISKCLRNMDATIDSVETRLSSLNAQMESYHSEPSKRATLPPLARRVGTFTSATGSPSRAAAEMSHIPSLTTMFSSMGANIERRSVTMPNMPAPQQFSSTSPQQLGNSIPRPAIEGPNGVFYEMPDAMLEARLERNDADSSSGQQN